MGINTKRFVKTYVDSQNYSGTAEKVNPIKGLFRDALQQVMDSELNAELGYEKHERVSETFMKFVENIATLFL